MYTCTFQFALGDIVKDSVTGYKGTVVGRTEWLNGCVRYAVQGPMNKDGKVDDGISIDEQQLVLVKKATPKKPAKAPTGGPFPAAKRGQDSPILR